MVERERERELFETRLRDYNVGNKLADLINFSK